MIYCISDLHLSFGTNKPMNVFGVKWNNYEERLQENWNKKVQQDDVVLICGDVSWAMYIDEAVLDFDFIDRLNGTKIISKGNHDYWWTTAKKQKEFLDKHSFNSIKFLHNNSFDLGDGISVCGARGWVGSDSWKNDEDRRIYERELIRLDLSLKSAPETATRKIAMLHYPPDRAVMEVLTAHNVQICLYGHLHGNSHKFAVGGTIEGVRYFLTSSDYLEFNPMEVDI